MKIFITVEDDFMEREDPQKKVHRKYTSQTINVVEANEAYDVLKKSLEDLLKEFRKVGRIN